MKKLNKKSKIILLFSSLVLVAGIAVVTMYATGVFPQQAKGGKHGSVLGNIYPTCHDANCSCHDNSACEIRCGGCKRCYHLNR